MEKNRNLKIVAFAALIISVLGLSIGYAAFSETLEIKGSAVVKGQAWDIHFEELAKSSAMTAKEIDAPEIKPSTTLIEGLKSEFDTPGQVSEYTFDIVNAGTFDAIITDVTISNPTCTGKGDNATTDAENVCKNVSVKVTDPDGAAIATGKTLAAGEKLEGCKITVTYDKDTTVEELPKDDVTVDDIDAIIIFSQN